MKVSKSYQSWKYDETKAFEKNGKLYVTATYKCDRCTKGVFVCRVENGQPVPHPAYGEVCLKCNGRGYLEKEIRLYTDEEFEKKEATAEKAKAKRLAEQEKKMKAEAEVKRAKWLDTNGFNESHETFIYFPQDSYNIKETLKDLGFKFSKLLLWHIAFIPEGYEDKVIKIQLEDIAEGSAWGDYHYNIDAESKVKSAIEQALPHPDSEWIGEVGSRIKEYPVTLSFIRGFEGRFGYSQIVCFEDICGNKLKWFTTVNLSNYSVGDSLLLSGTIKDNIEDQYERGAHVTLLTRCKVKVA